MNITRLGMMKNLMETIQADKDWLEKFDLSTWIEMDNGEDKRAMESYIEQLEEVNPQCGFSACACGWAGVTKEFNDMGLFSRAGQIIFTNAPTSVVNKAMYIHTNKYEDLDGDAITENTIEININKIREEGYTLIEDFEAVSEFFDIPFEIAECLFDPMYYARIRSNSKKVAGLQLSFPKELLYSLKTDGVQPKHVAYRVGLVLDGLTDASE